MQPEQTSLRVRLMYANFVPTLFFSDLDIPRYALSRLLYGDAFLSKTTIFTPKSVLASAQSYRYATVNECHF